jgi:integrase/recombinase XerD
MLSLFERVIINHLNIGGPMKFNQTFAVLFWLVRKNKNGQIPIYARLTIDGARMEISTRRSIAPEFWDSENERAIESYVDASILNDYLLQVRTEIHKHYNVLLAANDQVTVNMLRERYMNKKAKAPDRKSFSKYLDQYLKQLEDKVRVGDLSIGRFKKLKVLDNQIHFRSSGRNHHS